MASDYDYGLELTNNSKVGWAFRLPRSKTCVNATHICRRLCYGDCGNGFRYQSKGQRSKRERNFRTCELLLNKGGPSLLAENLSLVVSQAKLRDWLTARVMGGKTVIPWTFRIHDVDDFHSVEYAKAWRLVIQKCEQCSFWFYTRSFSDEKLFKALTVTW